VEGHSTVEDQWPRNSYHRVCYVFMEQAASACHRNWTAMGDDQCPTESDSRLRGTRQPLQQATDVRAPARGSEGAHKLPSGSGRMPNAFWCNLGINLPPSDCSTTSNFLCLLSTERNFPQFICPGRLKYLEHTIWQPHGGIVSIFRGIPLSTKDAWNKHCTYVMITYFICTGCVQSQHKQFLYGVK